MLARLLPALALLCGAEPVLAQASGGPGVNIKVLRPLQLTAQRNLQFGTVIMGTMTGSATVSVTPAGRTCGATLTCSALFSTAEYRVTGSARELVLISSRTPAVTMTSPAGGTLSMVPSFPSSIVIPNNGNRGIAFEVGGTLTIPHTAQGGIYTGTLEIEIAYQ